MRDQRPYLLRALNDWIVDSGCTPEIIVDASLRGVSVPPAAVTDGIVVLNIGPSAVSWLEIGDEGVALETRFQGVSHPVSLPLDAVLALRIRESGGVIPFRTPDGTRDEATDGSPDGSPDGSAPDDAPSDDEPPEDPRPGPPGLRVVK